MKRSVALAAGMAAVFATADANAAEFTFKIQDYAGTGNMLMRVATSKGFCTKRGIRCEMQMIPSGPLGVQALLANSIQVAFPPPEVVISAALKGAAVKIIGNGASRNGFELVARNGLDLPDGYKDFKAMMSALKGKKIGVPARGSGAEFQFVLLAEKAGMKATDFTFVAVGAPNTSYGALKSSQVDASMTFEPSASMCDVLKECRTVFLAGFAKEPKEIANTNGAYAVLLVTQDTIDKSADAVAALMGAVKDAEDFVHDPANFDEVVKISNTYFKFQLDRGDEIVAKSIRYNIPSYRVAVSRDALKQIAQNMVTTGQLSVPFDINRITYDKAP